MLNPDAITVAANGNVYVGALTDTPPTDPSETPSSPFLHTGLISEEGATFVDGKTLEPIPVWQLFYPARHVVTEKEANVNFAMREWNRVTVPLAYGGGDITEPTPGIYRFAPPAPGTIDNRQMIIKWVDGDKDYMLIVPKGMVSEDVETNLIKSAASDLPITFGVVGQESVDPWYILTNDPAWAPAGS